MKRLIFLFFTLAFFNVNAQTTAYWLGGTPGSETRWDVAQNWSTQRIPNEDSKVIIQGTNSGHNAMPIISGEIVVATIELRHGGILEIQRGGELILSGESTFSEGIICYGGHLINSGLISIEYLDQAAIKNVNQYASGIVKQRNLDHIVTIK